MTIKIAAQPSSEEWDLREFVQNAPVGMLETGPDHRVLWANQAGLDLLGYTAAEFDGADMSGFFADSADFRRLLLRLTRRHLVANEMVRFRCRDGSICPVSLSCNLHWKGSVIAGIRFVMRDMSDLKRSELELQRRQAEIESLNQRLQRAMSETHHRVKNNLQIIAALVDMQLMAHELQIPANELRRVERHIQALAAIHDLLTVDARKDPELEAISVKATLEVLRPLLQEMVGDRPVRFHIQDVRMPVHQETAVALIVNELIGNAARYGRGSIDLSLCVSGGRVCLEVRDRGPGFPQGFDAAACTNSGLELVETVSHWDLQGETNYANHPDGGAQVTVSFPLQRAATSGYSALAA